MIAKGHSGWARLLSNLLLIWLAGQSGPTNADASLRPAWATPNSAASGGAASFSPRFSADGRFLVFVSAAGNLVTNQPVGDRLNVFLRDLEAGTTALVSVSTNDAISGDGNSANPVLSSDGRFVAFESIAANLVVADGNGRSDVFVRDMWTGQTLLVSTGSAFHSRQPSMSPDGRWITYEKTLDSTRDLLIRDMQTGTSIQLNEGLLYAHQAEAAALSDDGQTIAFQSLDLPSGRGGSEGEVYVRRLSSSPAFWVSGIVYSNRSGAIVRSYNPVISADGYRLAFKTSWRTSYLDRVMTSALHYFDLQIGQLTLINSNVWENTSPAMTPDGRFVAYESDTNVLVWDRLTATNTLVNVDVTGGGPARGSAFHPRLNSDRSRIAFLSDADNLIPSGGNGYVQLYVRDMTNGITRMISSRLDGKPASDLGVIYPDLSEDGRQVAFESNDEALVANDGNHATDVFVHDLDNAATALVSARNLDKPSLTSLGYVTLRENSVSLDGRFVVFSSVGGEHGEAGHPFLQQIVVHALDTRTNVQIDLFADSQVTARWPVLSADGRTVAYVGRHVAEPATPDYLYVRDREASSAVIASRSRTGAIRPFSSNAIPSLSGDGRLIAFASDGADLVTSDENGYSDVFVRDLERGTNLLISIKRTGLGSANNSSVNPVISRDGRWVIFESLATDLTASFSSGLSFELFARDLQANVTLQIGWDPNERANKPGTFAPVLNPAGSVVLFSTPGNFIWKFDLDTRIRQLVCTNCSHPAMSADGKWVAYETRFNDATKNEVVLQDSVSGSTELVSVDREGTGGGDGSSFAPAVSGDGRYVIFVSRATNLVASDDNGVSDIFIRDRVTHTTFLASLNQSGTRSGRGISSKPILGPDGRTLVFKSFASDLVDGDFNNGPDLIVIRLGSADSDGDGLDDNWELTYFGSLSRDGRGDFDADGQSDLMEFQAGTDPTNEGSILRVLAITSMKGGTTLLWSAVPGRKYRVQFKNGVGDPDWTDLPGLVSAFGWTASKVDENFAAKQNRFYRVSLQP